MEQLAEGELGNKKSSPSFQIGFSWSPEFRYGIGIQTGVYYELSVDNLSNFGGYISTSCKLDEHTLSIPSESTVEIRDNQRPQYISVHRSKF